MDTPANLDLSEDWWVTLISRESQSGEIPLPAVDSIVIDAERLPMIWLIVPEGTPGDPSALVNVKGMGPGDRLTLEIFLRNLEGLIIDNSEKVTAPLQAVWHLGGVEYEFHFADGKLELSDLTPGIQQAAWTMLRAIACIGEHNIDIEASIPHVVGIA